MIKEYGLNKEKRAKLTGEIEAYYKENPNAISEIGMSGDEAQDKKDFLEREKFIKGDMNMAQLEGLAGKLARGDVLKTKYAQNEARAIANELGRVNLGISKEFKDTRINIEKDKGILSDLATKLAVELNPEKKKLLQAQMSDAIKNFGLGDQRRELEKATIDSALDNLDYKTDAEKQAALLSSATSKADIGLVNPRAEATEAALTTSVMKNEQAQNLIPGDTSLAIKKQKLDSRKIDGENFLIDAFGGAKGKSKFDYRGEELKRENFEKGLEYLGARIDYIKYLSTAKNVPIDTKKQYASLVSHSGKILDTTVEDPDTGNQITFQEYMEKANDDPDLYPLKGDGSGAAGVLYGNFQNAQKQIIDFGKTIQVQVDDGQGAGGSPAPTGSVMPFRQRSPQEAMKALRDRIGELRRLGPDINARRQQLGQPGQFMPTPQVPMGGGGFTLGSNQAPQTVDYIQQQGGSLTQQEAQRKLDLAEAEAQLQDLQNQFGVR